MGPPPIRFRIGELHPGSSPQHADANEEPQQYRLAAGSCDKHQCQGSRFEDSLSICRKRYQIQIKMIDFEKRFRNILPLT